MKRNLPPLADETFDVLILGGGINGLATAWDCTLRGLKVALVEKGDFGGETSAASLKIIHGGLRYLQHADFGRMRESILERRSFFRMAPHLVDPFPFLVPTYGRGMKGKRVMATALRINDWMSGDRNRGIRDEKKHLPPGQIVDKEACLRYAPVVPDEGLTGGAIFYDGRMYNGERVTLSFALSAAGKGAVLANYVEAVALREDGAAVKDVVTGNVFDVRAKVIVSALGPWTEPFLTKKPVPYSAGMQMVTRPVTTEGMGLAVPGHHVDPDARVDRGGRHYFTTPWRGHTIWGTTDSLYEGNPSAWCIEEADIEAFLSDLNAALPSLGLAREDVVHAYGGLRPIAEANVNSGAQVSRKYEIFEHEQPNLVSMVGVKYTACRIMAEKMTDLVFRKLGKQSPACETAVTPLAGGDFESIEALCRNARNHAPEALNQPKVQHIVRNYGTLANQIFARVEKHPELAKYVPGSEDVIRAEVVHAIEEEAVVAVDDLLLRRTEIGTLGKVPDEARTYCSELLHPNYQI